MKLCTVLIADPQYSNKNPVESVAVLDETNQTWIPLCLHGVDHSNNMLDFLEYYNHSNGVCKLQLEQLLANYPKLENTKCQFEVKLLPFRPVSWRDCSLWEKHMVNSARNLVKNKVGFPLSLILSFLEMPFRLIGKPFPLFRPSKLWYQQPLHYMGNHLNIYGDGDIIPVPSYATFFDYELEIGVVIAKTGRNLTPKQAEDTIGGFVIWNDFSVRNVQLDEVFGKLGFGKSKNSCNQMSSILVTRDELLPKLASSSLRATCKVNSRLVAESSTDGMIHSVGETVAFISQSETLHPGEVIGLGTIPSCCGIESNQRLNENDHLELYVEGIGTLKSTIGSKENIPADHWKEEAERVRSVLPTRLSLQVLLALLVAIVGFLIVSGTSPIDPDFHEPGPIVEVPSGLNCPVHFVQSVEFFRNGSFAPESFAFDSDSNTLYTSMRDGTVRIIDFDANSNTIIARTGSVAQDTLPPLSACTSPRMQHLCGAPLGLFYKNGLLYVADAYFGILQIDVQNRYEMKQIVRDYNFQPFKFTNNVLVTSDGTIYFTDSSTKFYLSDYQLESLEGNGLGRLFRYNPRSNKLDLLLSNLHFANGLAISNDESVLYISETTRFRVREFYLGEEDKKNEQPHYLIDNLPCFPDNIRIFGDEMTVGCASPRTGLTQYFSRHPGIKKALTKLPFFSAIFTLIRPKAALILIIDVQQKVLKKAYYDARKRFHSISEANIYGNYMYIGSFHNPFVARFKYPA